jgi:hypothetical protein
MAKDIDIIKVITHADGGEPYSNSVSHYPSKEDSVAVKGYGVVDNDLATAQKQFDTVTQYYGNNGKNQFIHVVMSFLTETAPDAATAMEISDQVLEPLKGKHLMLTGTHEKHTAKSDYHIHDIINTTDLETGKVLHPNNTFNYAMAQRTADIIQKPVQLVIEKKNMDTNTTQDGDNNTEGKNDFKRIFYPHKNTTD